jgi:hypothetical protein
LKPLASGVNKFSEGAEGLWVIPLVKDIVPCELLCEQNYIYAVEFVLERLGLSREFRNQRKGRLDHKYLRQSEYTQRLWNQLTLAQGNGKLTPVVPAQFGKGHRGESVDYVRYARKDKMENEIFFGVYHIGVMLLTHPEREQVWNQLHVDCAGDEYAPNGDGHFVSAPFLPGAMASFNLAQPGRARRSGNLVLRLVLLRRTLILEISPGVIYLIKDSPFSICLEIRFKS